MTLVKRCSNSWYRIYCILHVQKKIKREPQAYSQFIQPKWNKCTFRFDQLAHDYHTFAMLQCESAKIIAPLTNAHASFAHYLQHIKEDMAVAWEQVYEQYKQVHQFVSKCEAQQVPNTRSNWKRARNASGMFSKHDALQCIAKLQNEVNQFLYVPMIE